MAEDIIQQQQDDIQGQAPAQGQDAPLEQSPVQGKQAQWKMPSVSTR